MRSAHSSQPNVPPPPLIIRVWHQTAQSVTADVHCPAFISRMFMWATVSAQLWHRQPSNARRGRQRSGEPAAVTGTDTRREECGAPATRLSSQVPNNQERLYQFYFSGKHIAPICIFFFSPPPLRWHVFLLNPSDQNALWCPFADVAVPLWRKRMT